MKNLQTQAAYVWEGTEAEYGHTNKYVQQAYIHGVDISSQPQAKCTITVWKFFNSTLLSGITKHKCCKTQHQITGRHILRILHENNLNAEDTTSHKKISLSNKATVYLYGMVNEHNSCECGSENAHPMTEYVWDNPKTSFCALRCGKVCRHCFDGGKTVGKTVMTLLLDNKQTNILCQHGGTSHIHMELRTFSRRQLPSNGSARGIYFLVSMISKPDPRDFIERDSMKDEALFRQCL
jgi:hypothetical protein